MSTQTDDFDIDHDGGEVVLMPTRSMNPGDTIQMAPDQARALAHILTEHAAATDAVQRPVLTVDLLGRAAYLAYCTATDGRSAITGDVLPPWDQLMPELREAWRAVADGVQMVISVGRPA